MLDLRTATLMLTLPMIVVAGLLASKARAADMVDLTLEQAIAEAKQHSPAVQSLQNQYASAQAKVRQALAPYEPSMNLTFNDMAKPFDLGHPASTGVQFQEQIGFPGRAFVNRSVLSNQANALKAQMEGAELQVAASTRAAYFQLSLAQQSIELNLENREAYQQMLAIAKRRYASGTISQVDLISAEVSLYQNTNDSSDLDAAEIVARTQLNILLGRPSGSVAHVGAFKSTYFSLPADEEAEKRMLENQHELHAARFQYEAASDAVQLAKMSLLPDFQVMAGMTDYKVWQASPWVSNGAPNQPTYTYMAGVQVVIPLFGLFNEGEAIRGARADRAAADANLQVAINQSRLALKTALANLRSLEIKLKINEDHLLPLSEQALSLALINYSAGKIDFQTLAGAAASRRTVRHDYLAAVVTYLTTYSSLGQLLGEEL